ncbi:MAG TPA: hypothetical protein PLB39_01005 [Thermoleophilia bacterium]|nr:hypothetical protein [Thermoleophilia bacterium]
MKFWAGYLRTKHNLFARPDQRLRFGRLAEFDVDHGIDDLYWKPTDAQPTRTGTGLHTGEGLSEQGTLDLGGAQ